MKTNAKTSIKIGFALSGTLLIGLLAIPFALADDQPSLIESALDGKIDDKSLTIPHEKSSSAADAAAQSANKSTIKHVTSVKKVKPPKQDRKVSSTSNEVSPSSSVSSSGSKTKGTIAGVSNSKVDAANRPVVVTVPPKPKSGESDIPEPKETLEPPIHSMLPATQNQYFHVITMPVKIGESYAIDQYRGKPALPQVQTITFGAPSWAIPQKKQIAALPAVAPITVPPQAKPNAATQNPVSQNPAALPPAVTPNKSTPSESANQTSSNQSPATAAHGTQANAGAQATVNIRLLAPTLNFRPQDSVWAYPYPPKLPKQIEIHPLPESEGPIRGLSLQLGYSQRPDRSRPYPTGGWRVIHAFDTAVKKAGVGYPHTMVTAYRWVDKVFPYVAAEMREMNVIEEKRCQHYLQVAEDYERLHADLEAEATTKGLTPVEIKISSRGIGQYQLPTGNWWIVAVRKIPGLKFYWQVPVSCNGGQIINLQLNEANALVIGGGW